MLPKIKFVTELTYNEAKEFFLKGESYFGLELPPYFTFHPLINTISEMLQCQANYNLYYCKKNPPTECTEVNYVMLHNKDGQYAWRPFHLIHPILYVILVHTITEKNNWKYIKDRFSEFRSNEKILSCGIPCLSLDARKDKDRQISHWWEYVEQRSIEVALKYQYVAHTDIVDCYGSIYTHSIAWALHEKDQAKKYRRNKNLIGNNIDLIIRQMSQGQTNATLPLSIDPF